MFICVAAHEKVRTRTLVLMMLIGLLSTSASIVRAHRSQLTTPIDQLLRPQDKELIAASKINRGEEVVLDFPDAAYAGFPIDVKGEDIFVLKYQ